MPISAAFRIFVLIVIIIAFFMLLPVIKNLRQNAKAVETEQEQVTGEEEGTGNREQVTEKPAPPVQPATPPAQPVTPPAKPATPPAQPVKPVETRDRSIYLIKKVNDGTSLVLVKVNRNLNANTPLTDSINALLAGPAPDEIMREIESRVPEGTRLLSADIIGTTAVLNFSKEFTYSHWGSEGCAALVKQIVWTATEFSNIRNVQFLIEGQKVDFLSEGVGIYNPIGR